jgi:DNA-binding NarL/FixJ family response regulator
VIIKTKFEKGEIIISIRIPVRVEVQEARDTLTPQESKVLELVSKGKINKEIGNELNISERTVKYHVSNLLLKFGVKTRQDLADKRQNQKGEK